MTDNRVLVDQNGKEAVWCNRGDGLGVSMLRDVGVEVLVLSTEANPLVTARCKKLHIECVQNSKNKLQALKEIADNYFFHFYHNSNKNRLTQPLLFYLPLFHHPLLEQALVFL